jgi:hypothetical protein
MRRPVAYVAAEGARSLHRRLAAWKAHHQHPGPSGVHWMSRRLDLRDPIAVDRFARTLEALGRGGLFVLDTLPRCIQGANENSPDDMGAALHAIDTIRERTGWGALLISHPARDGGDTPRGHSCQDGASDAVWVLRDHDTHRFLSCSKLKDGDEGFSLSCSLVARPEGMVLVPTSCAQLRGELTPNQRAVLRAIRDIDHGPGVQQVSISEASKIEKSTVSRALKKLVGDRYVSLKGQRYSLTTAGQLQVTG